jgi:hypothetical protein
MQNDGSALKKTATMGNGLNKPDEKTQKHLNVNGEL